MFKRKQHNILQQRLAERRRFIQILAGPRQVGKTTLARQVMQVFAGQSHYASADLPSLPDANWLIQQWQLARMLTKTGPALLILDETHKVVRWSEAVKMLWDEDAAAGVDLRVVLLGSSQFLLQQGLSESLVGRFELIRVPHWSFVEMRDAFGWDVDRFIFFGGYPGVAELISDEFRWRSYVIDSIIEPTLSRDVLQLTRVDKPALLRRLFVLGCQYSGQVLSYQKMLGQLQESGNTVTLAHYLQLLAAAWMLTGLDKHTGDVARSRASSPKLLVHNTALMSAQMGVSFAEARRDGALWGRLVESAIGAHLLNEAAPGMRVTWWRERNQEVDFVLSQGDWRMPIEVKSGRNKGAFPGFAAFSKQWATADGRVVGTGGIPLDLFLSTPPVAWRSD